MTKKIILKSATLVHLEAQIFTVNAMVWTNGISTPSAEVMCLKELWILSVV